LLLDRLAEAGELSESFSTGEARPERQLAFESPDLDL
jgi:hypothetical protein